jgi:hypothetical protein
MLVAHCDPIALRGWHHAASSAPSSCAGCWGTRLHERATGPPCPLSPSAPELALTTFLDPSKRDWCCMPHQACTHFGGATNGSQCVPPAGVVPPSRAAPVSMDDMPRVGKPQWETAGGPYCKAVQPPNSHAMHVCEWAAVVSRTWTRRPTTAGNSLLWQAVVQQ